MSFFLYLHESWSSFAGILAAPGTVIRQDLHGCFFWVLKKNEEARDSLVSLKLLFICQFLHVKISEKTNNLQRILDVICLLAEILSASPVVLRSGRGSSPPSSFFTPKQHADTLPIELT